METILIKAPLGAEIRCGDIRKLSYFDLGLLENIFLENLVVLIRNQDLNDHEIIDFGKKLCFGWGDDFYSILVEMVKMHFKERGIKQ